MATSSAGIFVFTACGFSHHMPCCTLCRLDCLGSWPHSSPNVGRSEPARSRSVVVLGFAIEWVQFQSHQGNPFETWDLPNDALGPAWGRSSPMPGPRNTARLTQCIRCNTFIFLWFAAVAADLSVVKSLILW